MNSRIASGVISLIVFAKVLDLTATPPRLVANQGTDIVDKSMFRSFLVSTAKDFTKLVGKLENYRPKTSL